MTTGIKFAAAIELTQQFVLQLQSNSLSPQQVTDFVSDLVTTQEGARGFFVGYLTSELDIADRPTDAIIQGLSSHPEVIAELLVKNLAMSTAQEVHFLREGQSDIAANSATVASRSCQLIRLLNLALIEDICQQLTNSIKSDSGAYIDFLERWGYDEEQKKAIQERLAKL